MIARHPFNTWPLHVKLFTEEAVKIWVAASAAKHAPAMPPGFICSIELEGVDGKSGLRGSGRKGPIAVKDGQIPCFVYESILAYLFSTAEFTYAHLAKHTSLLATRRRLECNICHKPIDSYAMVGIHWILFLTLSFSLSGATRSKLMPFPALYRRVASFLPFSAFPHIRRSQQAKQKSIRAYSSRWEL